MKYGTVVFLIFLVLKLMGIIAWSWWWVTLPLWGPYILAFGFGFFVTFLVGLGLASGKTRVKVRSRR